MGRQNIIVIGIAVFLGLIAVLLANSVFSGVEDREAAVIANTRVVPVAVAAQAIDYAGKLTNTNVRMVNWPSDTVPAGAFTKLGEALNNRVALRPLVAGEPILASRVSGTDGRATLAANLPQGKLAVAIPISDVAGVAGFVRPGDSVDVMITRQIPGSLNAAEAKMTDVLMQAIPVLAIDQIADSNKTDAVVAKTATLEVDIHGAQRLALARELGTLSLALRNVASKDLGGTRTVLPRDLTQAGALVRPAATPITAPARRPAPRKPAVAVAPRQGPSMTVFRKGEPTNYEVHHGY